MTSAERQERIAKLKQLASVYQKIKSTRKLTAQEAHEYIEILDELERVQRIEDGFQDIMVFAKNYFQGTPPHDLLKPDTPSPQFHYDLAAYLREAVLDPMERKTAIAAPRSHAKCVDGNSIVYTRTGRKRLIDINVGDEVLSMGKDLKMTFSRVSNKWESGIKDVYDVITKSGHKITATADHKFYTMDGYKRLRELGVGDNIAITRTLANEAATERPVYEVRFLAYMIAEGSLSCGNCSFTNADPIIVDDFIRCAEAMGFDVRPYGITYKLSGGCRDYFRSQGLYGHLAKTKRLPGWVFDLSPQLKAEFLSAMWDTDGYIARSAQSIGITLANSELIDDIREILLSLGIQGRKLFRMQKCGEKKFPAWTLHISDSENILRFHKKIHLLLKQDKLDALADKARKRLPHPTNDGIPPTWRKHLVKSSHFYREKYGLRVDNHYTTSREKLQRLTSLGHEEEFLTHLAHSDIFWDEIASIECVGPSMTYDIEVEGTHNFVANSFVVHNSTIVTNIFPIWCVCYVDDVKERYWVIIGDKQDNARKFLDVIKSEFEDNDLLKADFGNLKGSTWNALEIITANNVKISAHGAGEGLRGLRYGSFRPSVIIDDAESDESVSTPDRIAKMVDWFERTVLPLGDPMHSKFFVVGTIIHYNSLLSQIMRDKPEWRHFKYKAVMTFPERMDLWKEWEDIFHSRTEGNSPEEASRISRAKAMKLYEENREEMERGAEVLWPERMSLIKLMEKRAERRLAFNSEFQNSPIDEDTRIFHAIHYYKPWELNLEECEIFGACDPSMGQSKRSDPSAIVTVARDKRGILYVLDVDTKRRHPDQIIQDIFRKARALPFRKFSVETIAFQQFMKDEITKRSAEQGVYLPVVEFKSSTKKEIRIAAIEPLVSSGQIRFLESQRDLIEEMEYFPKAAHDDSIDCLAQCVELAKKGASSFMWSKL